MFTNKDRETFLLVWLLLHGLDVVKEVVDIVDEIVDSVVWEVN